MENFEIFLDFITGQGTILVRNQEEFDKFVALLQYHKVERIPGRKEKCLNYYYWKELAIINGKDPKIMCFEYQSGKGISWYDNIEKPSEWYGNEPMVIEEVA